MQRIQNVQHVQNMQKCKYAKCATKNAKNAKIAKMQKHAQQMLNRGITDTKLPYSWSKKYAGTVPAINHGINISNVPSSSLLLQKSILQ